MAELYREAMAITRATVRQAETVMQSRETLARRAPACSSLSVREGGTGARACFLEVVLLSGPTRRRSSRILRDVAAGSWRSRISQFADTPSKSRLR